jgi:hypothetical protein
VVVNSWALGVLPRSVSTYSNCAMLFTTGEGSPSKWLGTRAHHPKDWTSQHSGHQLLVEFQYQPNAERLLSTSLRKLLSWPRGPMARRLTTIHNWNQEIAGSIPAVVTSQHLSFALLFSIYLSSLPVLRSKFPFHGLPFVTCEAVAGCEFSMYL